MSGADRPEDFSAITLQTQMTPPLGQPSVRTSQSATDTAAANTTTETSNISTAVDAGTPGLLPNPPAEEVPEVHPMSMLNFLNQETDDQHAFNLY